MCNYLVDTARSVRRITIHTVFLLQFSDEVPLMLWVFLSPPSGPAVGMYQDPVHVLTTTLSLLEKTDPTSLSDYDSVWTFTTILTPTTRA